MASPALEIYTVGGGDLLYNIFYNMRLLVAGNNDGYWSIVKMVMVLGFAIATINFTIFKHDIGKFATHTLLATMLFFGSIGLKKNVIIIDTSADISDTSIYVVQDVPFLPAMTGHFFTTLSMWLTDQIDTIFTYGYKQKGEGKTWTLAESQKYARTGYGGMLIATRNFVGRVSFDMDYSGMRQFGKMLEDYIDQCFFPDVALMSESAKVSIYKHDSLIDAIKPVVSARPAENNFQEAGCNPGSQFITCNDFYNCVKTSWDGLYNGTAPETFFGKVQQTVDNLFGTVNEYLLKAIYGLTGTKPYQLQSVVSLSSTLSSGAADLSQAIFNVAATQSLQNVANDWRSTGNTDVDKLMQYSIGKQRAENMYAGRTMWENVAIYLPKFVVIMLGLFSFLAPIMVLMVFFPGYTKVVTNYITGMFAISLFNPIAALLNGFGNILWIENLSNSLGDVSPFSLSGIVSMYSMNINDYIAIIGMLGLSIPALALSISKGSEYAMLMAFSSAFSSVASGSGSQRAVADIQSGIGDAARISSATAVGMGIGELTAKTGVGHQMWEIAKNIAHDRTVGSLGMNQVARSLTGAELFSLAQGAGKMDTYNQYGFGQIQRSTANLTAQNIGVGSAFNGMDQAYVTGLTQAEQKIGEAQLIRNVAHYLGTSVAEAQQLYKTGFTATGDLRDKLLDRMGIDAETLKEKFGIDYDSPLSFKPQIDSSGHVQNIMGFETVQTGEDGMAHKFGYVAGKGMFDEVITTMNIGGHNYNVVKTTQYNKDGEIINSTASFTADQDNPLRIKGADGQEHEITGRVSIAGDVVTVKDGIMDGQKVADTTFQVDSETAQYFRSVTGYEDRDIQSDQTIRESIERSVNEISDIKLRQDINRFVSEDADQKPDYVQVGDKTYMVYGSVKQVGNKTVAEGAFFEVDEKGNVGRAIGTGVLQGEAQVVDHKFANGLEVKEHSFGDGAYLSLNQGYNKQTEQVDTTTVDTGTHINSLDALKDVKVVHQLFKNATYTDDKGRELIDINKVQQPLSDITKQIQTLVHANAEKGHVILDDFIKTFATNFSGQAGLGVKSATGASNAGVGVGIGLSVQQRKTESEKTGVELDYNTIYGMLVNKVKDHVEEYNEYRDIYQKQGISLDMYVAQQFTNDYKSFLNKVTIETAGAQSNDIRNNPNVKVEQINDKHGAIHTQKIKKVTAEEAHQNLMDSDDSRDLYHDVPPNYKKFTPNKKD